MERRYNFSLGRYFVSIAVDIVLLYGLWIVEAILIGFVAGGLSSPALETIIVTTIFVTWYFYYVVMFRKTGQTVGMKFLGLKVNCEKEALTFLDALIWGVFMCNPFTAYFSAIFIIIPPHYTLLERFTYTWISRG
jgi:uncharacterized RDD family membrane protein YckC